MVLVAMSGIYSIDINQTVATGVPADLQTHGYIDEQRRVVRQVAFVRPNGHVLLAGGSYFDSTPKIRNSTWPNPALYVFDAATGTTWGEPQAMSSMALMHSAQAAAAADDGSRFLFLYGGYGVSDSSPWTGSSGLMVIRGSDTTLIHANLTSPTSPGLVGASTLGCFNATHMVLTGGATELTSGDQWLLEERGLAWTRLAVNMARGRLQHRTVVYEDRYLIHVGGVSDDKPYALVEYVDMTMNRVRVGNIVNPLKGPLALAAGCMHLMGDVIVYVGGYQLKSASTPASAVLAPFLSLLQVQPQQDGTLQFKWVTGMPSKSYRPDAEASPSISESAPTGLATGAIAGIVASAVLIVAAVGFFAARRRNRNRSQKRAGVSLMQAGGGSAYSELARLVNVERSIHVLDVVCDAPPADATSIRAVDADLVQKEAAGDPTVHRLLLPGVALGNADPHEGALPTDASAPDAASIESTRAMVAVESTMDRIYLPGMERVLPASATTPAAE